MTHSNATQDLIEDAISAFEEILSDLRTSLRNQGLTERAIEQILTSIAGESA